MPPINGTMRWAANFVGLSAILHVLAFVISGFSAEAVVMLVIGVVYAGFAYGLLQGWRWLAYVVFIVMLMGTIAAVSNIWSLGAVPGWVHTSIAIANVLCVICLFGTLWNAPKTA